MRRNKLLILGFLLTANIIASAQNATQKTAQFPTLLELKPSINFDLSKKSSKHFLPTKNYYKELAVFCKLEYKIEKQSKIPLRMRLGSLDYVNRLEGKN